MSGAEVFPRVSPAFYHADNVIDVNVITLFQCDAADKAHRALVKY